MNFNYFISETVFRYILDAVELVADHGWRLLRDYRFDVASGLWRHRDGPIEPPLRLKDLAYDMGGHLRYPDEHHRAPLSSLPDYLVEARRLMATARLVEGGGTEDPRPQGVSDEFESLRWFDLPDACLSAPTTSS